MAIKNLGRVVGKSAYEVWLDQGNTGTEEEFFNSFVPVKGEDYFTDEELSEIQNYNNLSNKPMLHLTGTEETPVKFNELETGMYLVNGNCTPYTDSGINAVLENVFMDVIRTETHVYIMCLNVPANRINHYTVAIDGSSFEDGSTDFNTVQYETNVVVSDEVNPEITLVDNSSVQLTEPVESIYVAIPSDIKPGYHAEVIFTNSERSVSVQVNDNGHDAVYFGEDIYDGIPQLETGKTYHFEFTYDVSGLKCIVNRKSLLAAGESTLNKVTEINDDNFEEDYPTAQAVKTYVDNKIATDAEKIEDRGIFKVDLKTSYDVIHGTNTGTSISFNITDFTDISEKFTKILNYGLDKAIILLTLNYGLESISMIFTYGSYSGSGTNGRLYNFDQNGLSEFEGQLPNRKHTLKIRYDFDTNTVTSIGININSNKLLLNNNTISYEVATDYQPAHKQYVDNAIKANSSFGPNQVFVLKTDLNSGNFEMTEENTEGLAEFRAFIGTDWNTCKRNILLFVQFNNRMIYFPLVWGSGVNPHLAFESFNVYDNQQNRSIVRITYKFETDKFTVEKLASDNCYITSRTVDARISSAMANIDLSNYYTKEEMDASLEAIVDEKLGDIDTILTQIVDSTLDAEGKEY